MSSDDNHRQAHMTPIARKICGVFATSSSNFGPPTYLVPHYCCRGALHAVSYGRGHTLLYGVHGVDIMFTFLLVRFASAPLKI